MAHLFSNYNNKNQNNNFLYIFLHLIFSHQRIQWKKQYLNRVKWVLLKSYNVWQKGICERQTKIRSLDPRWKFRIRALCGLFLIVLPGNLATLGIYSTMLGMYKEKIQKFITLHKARSVYLWGWCRMLVEIGWPNVVLSIPKNLKKVQIYPNLVITLLEVNSLTLHNLNCIGLALCKAARPEK